ncbi:MAG: hypothetical protein QXO12_01355 [Candidatus Pacearchaeota archaeon]
MFEKSIRENKNYNNKNLDEIINNCKNEYIKEKYAEIKKQFLFFPGEKEFLKFLKITPEFFALEVNGSSVKNFYYVTNAKFYKKSFKIISGYDIINEANISGKFPIDKFYFIINKKI